MTSILDIDVTGKNVLVRADLEGELASPRLLATKALVEYLKSKLAGRIKVIGHEGNITLVDFLETDVNWDLRADPREKENSLEYATELAAGFDIYVNEAFGTSHRKHTSIEALPRFMQESGKAVTIGLRFAQEIAMLKKINAHQEDRVAVVGGIKIEDKNKYATSLESLGWTVLRGGLLRGADLRPDKLDISNDAISKYKIQISNAKTILAAGVMGKYEDASAATGTREILTAIATSSAYKIAGGGDIERAIDRFGFTDKFDWISVGGGAMLEYLSTGTLPGIEALL